MKFINSFVILVIAYTLLSVVNAYIGYFVGMTVSVLAGVVLGVEGSIIATVFAWLFVLLHSIAWVTTPFVLASKNYTDKNEEGKL